MANIALGLAVFFGELGIMQAIYAHKSGEVSAANLGFVFFLISGISASLAF